MDPDPLPPVHPDDPYYLTEPDELSDWWCDDDEWEGSEDQFRAWDQEVGVQWETR